jgi:sulfoquinovose isomerase
MSALPVTGPRFVERPVHRTWLLREAQRLIDFFQHTSIYAGGGFCTLDERGAPRPAADPARGVERQIHDTTRMVHCYAIAHLMGVPGADRVVDHGMAFIWNGHRDRKYGGYFWGIDDAGPTNATKQAYGHAFVLLAASSAKVVGHPDADRLLADVTGILETRFWENGPGATSEEYAADWSPLGDYRGQNSNMHLTEATMAAFEATGERRYLDMAESIAGLIIGRHARSEGWRVPEHYNGRWEADRSYDGNPMFRPYGTTPGHALEWSRLLIQLWELGDRRLDWLPEAAKGLFRRTVTDGWDPVTGGFYYTLDWNDRPHRPDRYWWPCAEGIGAAAVLAAIDSDPFFEDWYRRIWSFTANHLVDREGGGWIPELGEDLRPVSKVFSGRPDLYHALQACLIPLLPTNGSITRGLTRSGLA